uniref:Putative phosphatidylinositol kinase n=1 Tax=Moumouvirus sp. 'Monve' TaxID=1128131 RepID=H2EDM8_9VIRU|nr:putative phosphatidylinositol kinase [Moumouvirus Monve]
MNEKTSTSIVLSNKNNVWVEDHRVTSCHDCGKSFGAFTRKHHCRSCGNIFCYKCAGYSIVIPDFMDRPDPGDYWNISHYITNLKKDKERVCKNCYSTIYNKTKIYDKIANVLENSKPINEIYELSNSFIDVKDHYLNYLRNIQYYLPNHIYSTVDRNLLYVNAKFFSKHSKYLVHLIKSLEWKLSSQNLNKSSFEQSGQYIDSKRKKNLHMLANIINSDKNISCDKLCCTRTCNNQLSFDDCICILYSNVYTLPDELIQYLFNIIKNTPESIILCHITFFVNLIINNCHNKLLQNLIHQIVIKSEKIIYFTFWLLNNAKEKANMQNISNINSFIKMLDKELVNKMDREYRFFVGLIENLNSPQKYLTDVFERCDPISLPYNPEIKLLKAKINEIEIKSSYTRPVIIPFETTSGDIKILFKKESVMNDVVVQNLMYLCDIIIKENMFDNDYKINFGLISYHIMPLTNDSGMIQIIENAETIYSIINKKIPIIQHIVNKNEHKTNSTIASIIDKYMCSLVSYTLHSYFMGLGDRHLQNIMITDDGELFHIDFGFILGNDAYPLTSSDIKLNSDMLSVIGGKKSSRYGIYIKLCSDAVVVLRKYYNMFFVLLASGTNFKEKDIERFILSRFQPRQSDDTVVSELITIIENSDAYSDYIRDLLHYHTQERTIQNGISGIIKNAYSAVKNLTTN